MASRGGQNQRAVIMFCAAYSAQHIGGADVRVLLAAGMFALALSSMGSVEAASGAFGRIMPHARLPGLSSERADGTPSLVPVADAEHQRVAAAQLRLRSLGLYDGTTNGTLGPRTRAALSNYQAKVGLAVTGRLDDGTQYALAHDDLLRICLARGITATDCLGAIAQFYAPSAAPAPAADAGEACGGAKDLPACAHAIAEMGVWFDTLPSSQAQEPAFHAAPLR
jgi:hypothetical protein